MDKVEFEEYEKDLNDHRMQILEVTDDSILIDITDILELLNGN